MNPLVLHWTFLPIRRDILICSCFPESLQFRNAGLHRHHADNLAAAQECVLYSRNALNLSCFLCEINCFSRVSRWKSAKITGLASLSVAYVYIHSGKFGEVRMKPKNCGDMSFIHSARKYRFWMKPQTATQEIFIHSGKFGEVRMKPKVYGNKLFIHSARKYRFRMKPQNCGNKLFIHSARKYRFRMKQQTAAGELFIHSGKFGEVRMKPKNCGNKSFIHSARKYKFWIKPRVCGNKSFIHSANINEVWLAIDTSPCYVNK